MSLLRTADENNIVTYANMFVKLYKIGDNWPLSLCSNYKNLMEKGQ